MDPVLAAFAMALAAVGGTVGSRFVDRWYAQRNVGPLRQELVDTLADVAQARADRITQLEAALVTERANTARQAVEIDGLKGRVERLEKALETCLSRLTAAHFDIPFDPEVTT